MSRSRPGADRQAADLRRAGYRVVVAPVIQVKALAPPAPVGPFDFVIFLSEHAVRLGLPALERQPWFAGTQVLAVGARTAVVLENQGVTADVPAEPTSEGLLDLPQLDRLQGRRVLLAAGQGGRALLTRELAARGAEVQRYECYRRIPVDALEPAVLHCEAVIAASAEALERLARLWREAGGRADVPVLVPSARVAARGVELGLVNLHDCGGADSDAWRRGLATVQSAGNR